MAKRVSPRVLAKMQGRMDPRIKRLIFLSAGALLTVVAVLVVQDMRRPLRHRSLHLAAAALDVGDVRHHLRHHAKVDGCDSEGYRPLMRTVIGKPFEEPFDLRWSSSDVQKALKAWKAAREEEWPQRRDTINTLVRAGADVNAKSREGGLTCLFMAAMSDDANSVRLLVEKGAKVDEPADDNLTPLFGAAATNSPDAATALLEAGAKVNAEAKDGTTPLDSADGPEVVDVLRQYGAIRSDTDDFGRH